MKNKFKKGFTLIEVVIAVTIIGIMSSLSVLSYKNYIGVSNEAATKQELSELAQIYELGLVKGEVTFGTTMAYDDLKSAYQTITGNTLPFTSDELSFSSNSLTLSKRDVTATYDFNTKTITVN